MLLAATLIAFQLSGRLTSGHLPVPGATVLLGRQARISDADGRFAFDHVQNGTHTLDVQMDGFESISRPIDIEGADANVELSMSVSNEPGVVTVTCVLPNYVMGEVRDENGASIEDAEVVVASDRDPLRIKTDEHGIFRFIYRDPAIMIITVSKAGYAPAEYVARMDGGAKMAFTLCRTQR